MKLFLLDLEHRHGGGFKWTGRQFNLRKRRGHGMLVFAVDRAVVGYLAFVVTPRTAVLTRLLVHPSHRLKGVARQLLDRLAAVAGGRPVYTRVIETDTETLKFLRRYGIEESALTGPSGEVQDVTVRLKKPTPPPRA